MHIIRVYRRGYNDKAPHQVIKTVAEEFNFWQVVADLREMYPRERYSVTAQYYRTPVEGVK